MNTPTALAPLQEDLAALGAVWSGAVRSIGASGGAQSDVESMVGSGLIGVTDALCRLRRHADALFARLAGEVGRRSGAEFGTDGLAKSNGFHNATKLLAAATGGSTAEVDRLLSVGKATMTRQDFSGTLRPAIHPHVAAGLQSGAISVEAAAAITAMLDRVAHRADPVMADDVEEILAIRAAELPLHLIKRVIKHAVAQLDQDGTEPRDEERWLDRSVIIREDGNGMIHVVARLDPESAGPLKAAIEALVSDGLRAKQACTDAESSAAGGCSDGGAVSGHSGTVIDDTRTIPQRQADALVEIANHALGCAETLPPLASVTAVVRVDLETLRSGFGVGTIDGIDQPLSAGALRRAAAAADLIPAVLGTESVPLDVGRRARRFSRSQRIALTERDGGCASCGQNVAYVHAHHIRWWQRDAGPTDIANGVMLCSFCHHRIHREGWGIRATMNGVWFIPPPHVDPDRRPRLGGRVRFGMPTLARTG